MLDQGMKPLDDVAYQELLSKPIKFSLQDLKYNESSTLEYFPDGTQKSLISLSSTGVLPPAPVGVL